MLDEVHAVGKAPIRPSITRSHILRGEERQSQHLLGRCLSLVPIPALPPPLLSSLQLHRPKNKAGAGLDLLVTSPSSSRVWGRYPLLSRGPHGSLCSTLSISRAWSRTSITLALPHVPPLLPQVAMNKSLFYKREAAAFFLLLFLFDAPSIPTRALWHMLERRKPH